LLGEDVPPQQCAKFHYSGVDQPCVAVQNLAWCIRTAMLS
jgi:hypothetical protein